jgi:hypothetical protein
MQHGLLSALGEEGGRAGIHSRSGTAEVETLVNLGVVCRQIQVYQCGGKRPIATLAGYMPPDTELHHIAGTFVVVVGESLGALQRELLAAELGKVDDDFPSFCHGLNQRLDTEKSVRRAQGRGKGE